MGHTGEPGADAIIRCPAPGTETVDQKAFGLVGCGSTRVVEIQPDGWYKCEECGLDFDIHKVRSRAKLMAAAPTMLKALVAIVRSADHNGSPGWHEIEAARAAIEAAS